MKLRKNFPNNEFIVYILDERQRQMTEKNFLAFHRTYVSMDANTTSKHVEGPLQLLKGSCPHSMIADMLVSPGRCQFMPIVQPSQCSKDSISFHSYVS